MYSQVKRSIHASRLNRLLWLRAGGLLALTGAGISGLSEPVLATLPPELVEDAPLINPASLTNHLGSEKFASFSDEVTSPASVASILPDETAIANAESPPSIVQSQNSPATPFTRSQTVYKQKNDSLDSAKLDNPRLDTRVMATYSSRTDSMFGAVVESRGSLPQTELDLAQGDVRGMGESRLMTLPPERSTSAPWVDSANMTSYVGSERFVGFSNGADSTVSSLPDGSMLAQASSEPLPSADVRRQGSAILGRPSIQLQGVFKQEGSESSARARVTGTYAITPHSMFGAVVDLTTGNAFADSPRTGLDLNELYFATSPANLPELRFVVGLMDLTSYFDRNSFAKDGASHFFNLAFQTNPALSAAGVSSRIGVLANWNLTDNIEVKAATFSANRDLSQFALDSFAGELGVRLGPAIIRGTYVSSRDAGRRTGFREIFQFPRDDGFGLASGDRETAYGINAEVYIPQLKMGLFGRYGRYDNITLGQGGDTFSFGVTWLDLFGRDDRLGIGYGRQLSNEDLRRDSDAKVPDVLEVYYDLRVSKFLRAGVMVQQRNEFSETVVGFRLRTEFDVSPRGRR
ncbi:hypothetical protein ACKFKG_04245 [Phormidesmis sp. 146-35]